MWGCEWRGRVPQLNYNAFISLLQRSGASGPPLKFAKFEASHPPSTVFYCTVGRMTVDSYKNSVQCMVLGMNECRSSVVREQCALEIMSSNLTSSGLFGAVVGAKVLLAIGGGTSRMLRYAFFF